MNKRENTNAYNFKNNKKFSKVKKIFTLNDRAGRMFIVFISILMLLIIRLAWLQIVQGAELKEEMHRQLTASKTISPKRGTIYDSTGKALAISAQVDTVSIDPTRIIVEDENGDIDEAKTKALKEKVAKSFSEIFELDYEETLKKVSSTSSVVTIASKVEKDKIDKLKEIGDTIDTEVTPASFGRVAASTAKQVVIQKIREAARTRERPRCRVCAV